MIQNIVIHIIQEPKRESFTASDEIREKLQNIPVAIIESREEVHQYFAVRHLTGIRKWTPFAQAKYVFNELRKLIKEIKNIAGAIQKLEKNTNIKEKEVLHKYYQYALYKEFDNIIRDKQKKLHMRYKDTSITKKICLDFQDKTMHSLRRNYAQFETKLCTV